MYPLWHDQTLYQILWNQTLRGRVIAIKRLQIRGLSPTTDFTRAGGLQHPRSISHHGLHARRWIATSAFHHALTYQMSAIPDYPRLSYFHGRPNEIILLICKLDELRQIWRGHVQHNRPLRGWIIDDLITFTARWGATYIKVWFKFKECCFISRPDRLKLD